MRTLCPFFREECHGNECVMWKNEKCGLVSYFQEMSESKGFPGYDVPSAEEDMARVGFSKPPKWLTATTPEEIAEEIVDLKKREFPEKEIDAYSITNYYWSSKGVEKHLMPAEIQMKMLKAELLAQGEIRKYEDGQKKELLEKEREELPSLVSQCVDFARMNGLKRLTQGDVDTFVMVEKNLDLKREIRRAICAMANFKLKKRE